MIYNEELKLFISFYEKLSKIKTKYRNLINYNKNPKEDEVTFEVKPILDIPDNIKKALILLEEVIVMYGVINKEVSYPKDYYISKTEEVLSLEESNLVLSSLLVEIASCTEKLKSPIYKEQVHYIYMAKILCNFEIISTYILRELTEMENPRRQC